MIKFTASIAGGKNGISLDAHDGQAEVKLVVPGTEVASLLQLMCMKSKAFKVLIFELNDKKADKLEEKGE